MKEHTNTLSLRIPVRILAQVHASEGYLLVVRPEDDKLLTPLIEEPRLDAKGTVIPG